MRLDLKPRLTYANVMSSIAVFVALGGSAVATSHLVTAKDIRNGAVTTHKLGNGAVTAKKIRNQSVRPLKLARNAVFPAHIRDNAVRSAKIAPEAVTAGHLLDGAILSQKISPGAVTSTRLGNGSVIRQKLAGGAVGAGQLGSGAVVASKIASGAVQSAKIATGGVETSNIADGAVTADKLANPVRWVHARQQGQISKESGVVGVSWDTGSPGYYRVEFDADMSNCTFQATSADINNTRVIAARNDRDDGEFAEVRIRDADGTPVDSEFHLAAYC